MKHIVVGMIPALASVLCVSVDASKAFSSPGSLL